jgi:hypothetical protein
MCRLEVVKSVAPTNRKRHDVVDRQCERMLDPYVATDRQTADTADVAVALQNQRT